MKTISFRDIEQLSALLDAQLSRTEVARLGERLKNEPDLAAALKELREARTLLRRMPRRRIPRNFTLTPGMAGIRPPVPRAVPALSWASVMAMLLFVCTLGTNLFGRFSFGAAAPMMAAEAPAGMGGGQADNVVPEYGIGGGPESTPTPEMTILRAPEPTLAADTLIPEEPPSVKSEPEAADPWLLIWPGLAMALLLAAGLTRLVSIRAFRKRSKSPGPKA